MRAFILRRLALIQARATATSSCWARATPRRPWTCANFSAGTGTLITYVDLDTDQTRRNCWTAST